MKPINIFLTMIILLSFNLTTKCQNQTTINYYYDDAGNRKLRIIELNPLPRPHQNNDSGTIIVNQHAVNQFYKDKIGTVSINIFPNPTQDKIVVSLINQEKGETAYLDVYSTEGKIILQPEISDSNFEVDLSDKPVGIYIIRIRIKDSFSDWKIIKHN